MVNASAASSTRDAIYRFVRIDKSHKPTMRGQTWNLFLTAANHPNIKNAKISYGKMRKMRTEQSKSQAKGFRFNLRLLSILFFLVVLCVWAGFRVLQGHSASWIEGIAGRLVTLPPRHRQDHRSTSLLGEPLTRKGALNRSAGSPAVPVAARKAEDFRLQDPRDQGVVVLSDLLQKNKAVVLVFMGVECVINNQFVPVLIGLHKEYASKGIAFIGVNANSQDSRESVAMHARRNAIPFPIVKDAGNKVADQLGARRTPEAFIVDRTSTIRYQGRIDDQFGIGYARPDKPTRRDLAVALDEILAGKAVSVPRTEVAGCCIGRVAKPKADGQITYAKQISRILQKNCQECHRPGQIAPMSLLTFDDALAWSDTIREVISEGRMPPWYADPRYGRFSNDRRLSSKDKETLLGWIDNGTPRGDDKDLPPPRRFPEGWKIGTPDLIVQMPTPFEVPAKASPDGIPYQYIEVDPGIKEDRWVQRAEIRPGAPSVVHHSVVFVLRPGEAFDYTSINEPGAVLCGTAPGEMPLDLPEGLAKKIPAGSKLVFQMHYTSNGKAQRDQTSVGLIFATKPPRHRVITLPIYNQRFLWRLDRVPAGAENYRMDSEHVFSHDAHLLNFMPHMHLRGKDFLYEAIYPNGKKEILLSVPRYDFNWQSIYRLAEPLPMPKGTKLHCIAHFDNSDKNPNNPDPKKDAYWGWQTWDEMMTGWFDYYQDDEKP
jgi:peroxiredoxin